VSEYDLVVRGGQIADGLGSPLFEGDVAISGGRIAAVGRVNGRGAEEIDARGKLVTPGFVDIHTHYDGQAVWDDHLAPSSWNGVTTAVMGNCGVGFAPVRAADRERLIELMEGVEDIPGAALHEGLDFRWESFADYLAVLEGRRRDIDLCAQLPHGALRVYVMGERAARLEEATKDDIAKMRALAAEAMHAGAIGFTTTRSLNHRTVRGDPTPSLRAAEDELMGIAMGLADAGRGVLQFISDFDMPSLDEEFALWRRIAKESGRPLSVSLTQRHAMPGNWRKILDHIEAANAEGITIRAQVAPRPIGVLQGLQGSRNPFVHCASYAEVKGLPFEQRVEALRNPALRARLLEEVEAWQEDPIKRRVTAFTHMFPFSDPPNYEPDPASAVTVQAERRGVKPAEVAYEMLLADGGRGFIFSPVANFHEQNLDVIHEMIAHPHTVMGLSDGGAHVSVIADGSFPTYLLMHWGRDRPQGRFDLSWLVKRQTSDTARTVGLEDRGVLAPGLKGDLNVIDMERLHLHPPRMHSDLPAGGNRLLQKAEGYVATVCSGEVIFRDGVATGALPGKLVRGAQRPSIN